jgi:hypothetical protein
VTGINFGVANRDTSQSIANARITVTAYVFAPNTHGTVPAGILTQGGRSLAKVTDRYGNAGFDGSEFGFGVDPNGVDWRYDYLVQADGYDPYSSSQYHVAGDTWEFTSQRLVPKAVAPPPSPIVTTPTAGATQTTPGGVQAITKNLSDAGAGLTDALSRSITGATAPITKTIANVTIILVIGVVAVIFILLMTRGQSPSPARRATEQVQVRSVKVGEAGFDPATRRVGARNVEVLAR